MVAGVFMMILHLIPQSERCGNHVHRKVPTKDGRRQNKFLTSMNRTQPENICHFTRPFLAPPLVVCSLRLHRARQKD